VITKLISAATAVMAFALLIAGNAWAQDFDPCAGLTGQASGLCLAYVDAMGCSSDSPRASESACASVAMAFEQVTGSPPPSDCPCDLSLERVLDTAEGFDSTASYECRQDEFLDRTLPPSPNLFGFENTILFLIETPRRNGDAMITTIFADFGRVDFSCEYRSHEATVREGLGEITFSGAPDYGEKVEDFFHKYDACKGAIGTVVANFPFDLPTTDCTFD